MSSREVALIIRDARSSGFVQSEDDFSPYLQRRGVTIEDYERYERGRTIRHIVICVVFALAIVVIELYFTGRAGER